MCHASPDGNVSTIWYIYLSPNGPHIFVQIGTIFFIQYNKKTAFLCFCTIDSTPLSDVAHYCNFSLSRDAGRTRLGCHSVDDDDYDDDLRRHGVKVTSACQVRQKILLLRTQECVSRRQNNHGEANNALAKPLLYYRTQPKAFFSQYAYIVTKSKQSSNYLLPRTNSICRLHAVFHAWVIQGNRIKVAAFAVSMRNFPPFLTASP